jgi:hypothetical protein
MSWTYLVNQTPTNGAAAWVSFISTLMTAGWSLPQWSDATTVHTSGTPTAANLENLYAWFRLQAPADATTGNTREIVIQNFQAGPYDSWAGKYSAKATFTATTGTGNNTPTASDEVSVPGGGSCLGSSSHTTGVGVFYFAGDGAYRYHMAANSNGSFYYITSTTGTTSLRTGFMLDIPIPWAGAADQDTSGLYFEPSTTSTVYTPSDIQAVAHGHTGLILGSTTSVASLSYQVVSPTFVNVRTLPVNSFSGKAPLATPLWTSPYAANSTRGVAVRGWSTTLIFDLGSAARTNYDLFTVSANGDHIWLNGSLLPWPSGTAVTL